MISRIWRGWTRPGDADAYEHLLLTVIIPGIKERQIAGFNGIELLRRIDGDEVEFATIMWFQSRDAVIAFAGEQYGIAVVPPAAQALLSRFDERSGHYDIRLPRTDPDRG